MEPQRLSSTPPPPPASLYNPPYTPPTQEPVAGPSQKIEFPQSILDRAKLNDRAALEIMFRQFISIDEEIHFCEYLGQLGVIMNVTHSFACVTNKRMVALKVGSFDEVIYQDAGLEDLNSGIIYQPSILGLYIWGAILVIFTWGIGIFFLPVLVRWYYLVNKCGLVGFIKEGLSVYVFANRNRLIRANAMWRICKELRDKRISQLKTYASH